MTFAPKRKRYLVHGLVLRFYLKHGLTVEETHRAIRFRQKAFAAPFIEWCARERNRVASTSKVASDIYKLLGIDASASPPKPARRDVFINLGNAVFGKFIESYSKRMDVYFEFNRPSFLRRASSPRHKGTMVCSEDMTISFMTKRQVVQRQSWLVGFR